MKTLSKCILLAVVILLLPGNVNADFLTVQRTATIKANPQGGSQILTRPAIGDDLQLLNDNQTNGYYQVRSSAGDGWIYRTLVRRFPGNVPNATTTATNGIATGADQGNVDVMWWNIRDFSSNSRDDAELAHIASTIRGMEVVAIGELNDPAVLPRLTTMLGPTWQHANSPRVGRTSGTREHYGFIWDASVVSMVGGVRVDTDPGDAIDREPAYATFRTLNGNLDFTLIAVHITWGRLVGPRKAEVRQMGAVWNRVQAATPDDDDLILMGDFNRNVDDESFDDIMAIGDMVRANQDTGPTHITSNSTYDQIFLSTDETREWTETFETITFDELLFVDDIAAKLACSDHRPVWTSLRIPAQDDD